jgi:hypothetical protein
MRADPQAARIRRALFWNAAACAAASTPADGRQRAASLRGQILAPERTPVDHCEARVPDPMSQATRFRAARSGVGEMATKST